MTVATNTPLTLSALAGCGLALSLESLVRRAPYWLITCVAADAVLGVTDKATTTASVYMHVTSVST